MEGIRTTHEVVVEPSSKMDAPHLFQSRCSCGEYKSGPYGSEADARRAGLQHAAAKEEM